MNIYKAYLDESSQTAHKYMLFGGIVLHQNRLGDIEQQIENYRNAYKMKRELKWSKVSRGKLDEYKKLVDLVFDLINKGHIHFRSIIIDTHKINNRKYNQGDPEIGFYKFFYQLLIHCFGKDYCKSKVGSKIILHPDSRDSSISLDNFKSILNAGIAKEYKIDHNPFIEIEPLKSKDHNCLQINDIILGAIAYHKNGHHKKADASIAKKEMANYIAQKAGFHELGTNSKYGEKRFTIWNMYLRF